MPFRLTNAYSSLLDVAMKDIDRKFWTSYLDDILTLSRQPWEHYKHLTQVVLAHVGAGIKIQSCKIKLFQNQVEVPGAQDQQGMIFKDTWVRTADQGLAKAEDWKGGVHALRVCGILLHVHTTIFRPVEQIERDQEGGEVHMEWRDGERFEELKKAFMDGGIKAFPDFGTGNLFILSTDWSKENLTGDLSQVQDGQERFLGCWGRKCN